MSYVQPKCQVYGSSDDNIVVVGPAPRQADEIGDFNTPRRFVGFSDGTILRIAYAEGDEGLWRIALVRKGSAHFENAPATDEETNYTDRATLIGDDLHWWVAAKSERGVLRKLGKRGVVCQSTTGEAP